MANEYLRVSELNQLIQNVIRDGFPQPLWVCGEIQGYDRNRGKNHIFFELVEKDPDSKTIIAKIGLVLFAGRKSHIEEILKKSENAFSLKDDIEVKFACSIDFYPPHGAVRLIVESIDPTFTLGRLAQEKQKLIALLTKKGVLDQNKQVPLPLVPLSIGLVTADDSAAYNDFRSEMEKSGYGFCLYLRNALMQGNNAEKDICQAVDELIGLGGIDCIVITRGGGSIADLSCFDSQRIAEKIAACPVPVLTGIGHEINTTVTDLAAHTYAKTPTAIAQFLVGHVASFLNDLNEKFECISKGAGKKIQEEQRRLKSSAVDLHNRTRDYLKEHDAKVIRLREALKHKPVVLLNDRIKNLEEFRQALHRVTKTYMADQQTKLTHYRKMIDLAGPARALSRGFSITRNADGALIRKTRQAPEGASLTHEVADGIIRTRVQGQDYLK